MKKIYLAIPYSGMIESSYKQANEAAALILLMGYNVYSPISHGHTLVSASKIKIPHDWEFWKNIDYQFIDWADELFVLVPTEGSDKVKYSTGVNAEIDYALKAGKKVTSIQVIENKIITLANV
jgi:hypothetical protein